MNKIVFGQWGTFKVKDVFPHIEKPKVYHTREVKRNDEGIPYVVRSKYNNGIKYRVTRPSDIVNPPNVISFGSENATFFFQEEDWVSGRDIYYIDVKGLSKYACLFIIACLQQIATKYSYNYGLFPALLKEESIRLPITVNDLPDWEYMDLYMKNREEKTKSSIVGLLYMRKDMETKTVVTKEWRNFSIGKYFEVVKGTRLTKANMIDGEINFIGASATNNGVTAHITNDEHLHSKNTISVTYNGSVGEAFYQDEIFWASDDVNVLYPKFGLNKYVAMFIIPIIKKVGQQYGFIDKWKKEDMEKDYMRLPADREGQPDWKYMEIYMRQIEDKVKTQMNVLLS